MTRPAQPRICVVGSCMIDLIAEAETAARKLQARGTKAVILTLGERGALLLHDGGVEHVPAVKVDAVDPTGAGDAFVGSLAVEFW